MLCYRLSGMYILLYCNNILIVNIIKTLIFLFFEVINSGRRKLLSHQWQTMAWYGVQLYKPQVFEAFGHPYASLIQELSGDFLLCLTPFLNSFFTLVVMLTLRLLSLGKKMISFWCFSFFFFFLIIVLTITSTMADLRVKLQQNKEFQLSPKICQLISLQISSDPSFFFFFSSFLARVDDYSLWEDWFLKAYSSVSIAY